MKYFLCLLACVFPSFAFGAELGAFDIPGTDKSLEYLGLVFGQMGSLPLAGTGNTLFADLLSTFNQVVLVLGFVIIAYTATVSTINTAQEGEALGKKWSTIWVPVRSAAGIYLLLPSASGYSWIQIGVMWFILQGVGAANAIWEQVLNSYDEGVTINQPAEMKGSALTVFHIYKAKVCQEFLNTSGLYPIEEDIELFEDGDRIVWGYPSSKTQVCGSISVPSFLPNFIAGFASQVASLEPQIEEKKEQFIQAIEDVDFELGPPAQQLVESPDPDDWDMANNIRNADVGLNQAIGQISSGKKPGETFDEVSANARLDGWVHAGSYYFKLVAGNQMANTKITVSTQDMALKDQFGDSGETLKTELENKATKYFQYAVDAITGGKKPRASMSDRQFGTDPDLDNEASTAWNGMWGSFFTDIASAFTKHLTTGGAKGDPIVSMSKVGSDIVALTEAVIFIALTTTFLIMLPAGVMSCMNPLAGAMEKLFGLLISFALFLLGVLWMGAMSLALYVPLIPFLVFTFSVISWLILVIEALVAAPLIALVLIVPSEDEIGKAGNGLIILFGLFLRPSLMVIGFVVATKLVFVGITMLNFGFREILASNITGIGLFGGIAVVILYAGIAVTIIHECFAAIYMLPDKALRWMGGQPEGGDVMEKVKRGEQAVAKGAGVGKSTAGGALSYASDAGKGGGGMGKGGPMGGGGSV